MKGREVSHHLFRSWTLIPCVNLPMEVILYFGLQRPGNNIQLRRDRQSNEV